MKYRIPLLIALILFSLCSCSQKSPDNPVNDTDNNSESSSREVYYAVEQERVKYSFDEVILHSNSALIGTFADYRTEKDQIHYRFLVNKWLYGSTDDTEIELTSYTGEVLLDDQDESYPTGRKDLYETGKTYYLVTERSSSIFREKDIYVQSAEMILCADDDYYEIYDSRIELPEDVTMDRYILETYQKTHPESNASDSSDAEDPLKDTAFAGSAYIAVLHPVSILSEMKDTAGDSWFCEVEQILYGPESSLNTFEDGKIGVVLFRDQVEKDGSFIVGFHPVDTYSRVYLQESEQALLNYSEEALCEILSIISGLK